MSTSLPHPSGDGQGAAADVLQAGRSKDRPSATNCLAGSTGAVADQAGLLDTPADPFDPASLRLSQDFASTIGVKKVLTTLPEAQPT